MYKKEELIKLIDHSYRKTKSKNHLTQLKFTKGSRDSCLVSKNQTQSLTLFRKPDASSLLEVSLI